MSEPFDSDDNEKNLSESVSVKIGRLDQLSECDDLELQSQEVTMPKVSAGNNKQIIFAKMSYLSQKMNEI